MSFWPNGCFEGRQVLVTGGTSGIGLAIAKAFLAEGAIVTATGISSAETEQAAQDAPGLRTHILDVRSNDAITQLISALPALHHVVNCAGMIRRGDEHDPKVFADVLDVNLTGTMRVCAASREKLKAGGGSIVNTASVLSFQGGGLVPGYAASKGGVSQLTKSLAIAYAPDGIRVNAVAPGLVQTALTERIWQNERSAEASRQMHPLARFGTPEEVARMIVWLLRPDNSWITGQLFGVDGGLGTVRSAGR